jgi:hypothetical protein
MRTKLAEVHRVRASPAADKRSDRGRESVEELVEVAGEVGLDVEDRQPEHQDEARQHEAEPGEEAAELAAANPPEVDAELVGLRAGEDLVDGEKLLELLLGDPVLLVDALALDHGDLRRGPAPGEQAELQEPGEDRARRILAAGRRSSVAAGPPYSEHLLAPLDEASAEAEV